MTPAWSMKLWPAVRSKLWQSGRKLSAVHSWFTIGKTFSAARTLWTRLPWVSMTPLGSPVVPEV